MIKTTYQKPEIRDANDNIIQQGAFGKNTALANATNDGWIDYVANDLEFLYGIAKDEIVPVPSLPASGQMNKTYLLTTTGVSYRWSGTQWVAVSSSEAVGRAETAATNAQNYANAAQQSADDAQDTADDIAEHLVQIDKNTGGVAKNSKRISNIEKLLQGNLYDYDTDDDVAYTKTVPSGAMPYAGIEKIGGKTLAQNQLCKTTRQSITKNGIAFTNNTDGSWTINGTAKANSNIYFDVITLNLNHKYLLRGCPAGGSSSTYNLGFNGHFTDTGSGGIEEPTSITTGNFRFNFHTGDSFDNVTVYPQIFDLTLMFGAGNEPSTVEEFEAMFPASYYPYNAGTLLSAGVESVESTGKNLVPTYTESGSDNGLTWKANADGSLTINGTATADTYIRPAEYSTWTWDGVTPCWLSGCPENGGTTKYQLRMDTENDALARATPDNGRGMGLSNNNSSHPIQGLPLRFCVVIRSGFVCNNLTFRPMLEYGSVATSYSPYVESSFPIPAEVQALDGYGWSAGTAYNYIDFERKVFVKNVEGVDLGTLSWVYSSSYGNFNANPGYTDSTKNMINNPSGIACSRYVFKGVYNTLTDMSCGYIYYKNMAVKDESFNGDATAFKTAMSGVYAYYPLANPIETDISQYLTDNLIEVGAGGTLTFENSNGDDYHIPVPSDVTYMIDLQEAIENGN